MQVHYAGGRVRAAESVWGGTTPLARAARVGLLPVEALFRLGTSFHHARYSRGVARVQRAGVPVISIGNLTVGGTGKTPVTRWLVHELKARHRRPGILHGGYGLDEPALHRSWYADVPVIVERDRVAGAARAAAEGADVLVLDDGFQHRRLHRDLDVVLVAAEQWTERRRRLPRGPWREGLSALRRAGVVLVTQKSAGPNHAATVADRLAAHTTGIVGIARLAPAGWRGGAGPGTAPAVLVTAVGDWRTVAAHAETAGGHLDEALIFADHHPFDAADAERIRRFAGARPVVCTEKDWVKLRDVLPAAMLHVVTLAVEIVVGGKAIAGALDAVLRA